MNTQNTNETALTAIESAYTEATGSWTTADWTHESKPREEVWDEVFKRPTWTESEECPGDSPETCPTCAAAQDDAKAAEEHAAEAMAALRAGDWDAARDGARIVKLLESDYGDCPIWGPWADAIESAWEARDEPGQDQVQTDDILDELSWTYAAADRDTTGYHVRDYFEADMLADTYPDRRAAIKAIRAAYLGDDGHGIGLSVDSFEP